MFPKQIHVLARIADVIIFPMPSYLLVTVFVAGMGVLGAEMSVSRLLSNHFGSSNLVWASVIGMVMLYLAIGYFLGGRLADRYPQAYLLYLLLLMGSSTLALATLFARPVVNWAALAFAELASGLLLASFFTLLVLFSLPFILLAMISPFALRLAIQRTEQSGQLAGLLYALSTFGSLLGTFLPVLITTPLLGTPRTFLLFSLIMGGIAAGGLLLERHFRLLLFAIVLNLLILLAFFFSPAFSRPVPGKIYEGESAYNYILVQEINGVRLLRLNEGQGVHSIYAPDRLFYGGTWEQFLVAPFFYPHRRPTDVHRIAILGLAAGTVARQATAIYGTIPLDGWEIDPKIVEVGKRYFGLDLPNLNIYIEDARWGLARSHERYDLIAIDAYRPPYIPPHLTTREFFLICAEHLTEKGAIAINVAALPQDRRLVDAIATTMHSVFPSVHVMDVPNTLNVMIFATRQPTQAQDFLRNLFDLMTQPDTPPLLLQTMQVTVLHLRQPGYMPSEIFTDDRSSLEWIVDSMILKFLLQGDREGLR